MRVKRHDEPAPEKSSLLNAILILVASILFFFCGHVLGEYVAVKRMCIEKHKDAEFYQNRKELEGQCIMDYNKRHQPFIKY